MTSLMRASRPLRVEVTGKYPPILAVLSIMAQIAFPGIVC
jgi:hypothetical protein